MMMLILTDLYFQHLPPLKSKLIGGPGTLFNGSHSQHGNHGHDNCDSMSINGSLVSNGSVTSVAAAANTGQTNGLSNGHGSVHSNGLATLPLVRPTTGDTASRASTNLDSPKHDTATTQNGTGSGTREITDQPLADPFSHLSFSLSPVSVSVRSPVSM